MRKPEQDEEDCEFKEEDIDEKTSPGPEEGTKAGPASKPIPKLMEERKFPATPSAPNNSASYLKSLASPMQNRRPMKQKPEKGSYFKRLAEASISAPKSAQPEIETIQIIKNDSEFQTAMSHPDVEELGKKETATTESEETKKQRENQAAETGAKEEGDKNSTAKPFKGGAGKTRALLMGNV